jgi:4-hydroxybenzoate polyprenyltransferase
MIEIAAQVVFVAFACSMGFCSGYVAAREMGAPHASLVAVVTALAAAAIFALLAYDIIT